MRACAGTKCEVIGAHEHHSAAEHCLPAFHGVVERQTGKSILFLCGSTTARGRNWVLGAAPLSDPGLPFDQFVSTHYPGWVQHFANMRRDGAADFSLRLATAWVNVRHIICAKHNMNLAVSLADVSNWERYEVAGKPRIQVSPSKSVPPICRSAFPFFTRHEACCIHLSHRMHHLLQDVVWDEEDDH